MSAQARPTYQQLVTSVLGDYKKQPAQAIVKEVTAKRDETDQNKCRHFVKLTLKKMTRRNSSQRTGCNWFLKIAQGCCYKAKEGR